LPPLREREQRLNLVFNPDGFSDRLQRHPRNKGAKAAVANSLSKPIPTPIWRSARQAPKRQSLFASSLAQVEGDVRPRAGGYRDRMRAEFLDADSSTMSEDELLELVLISAVPRTDVKPLTKRLLAIFSDLNGLIAASKDDILKVRGTTPQVFFYLKLIGVISQRMGRAKIMNCHVLSSWDAVIAYTRTAMAYRTTEAFRVLFLDRRNILIADEELGQGTTDHVPVYPREVARRTLILRASSILLVHNHPSGDPTPSPADIDMTLAIVEACSAVGVTVHDHIVIGREGEASFRGLGLLPETILA
jgi:DNA repair protein RadC